MTRELPLLNRFYEIWYNRLNNDDQDLRIIMTGDTGLGKSERCVFLGNELDPHFNLQDDPELDKVIMDSYSFLDTISNIKGREQRGGFFVGDELGLWASNRDWAKPMNKALSAIFQGGRYKNLGLALSVPSLDLIDSQLRGLFHYYIEIIDLRKKDNIALAIIQEIQKNKKSGRLYFKYPRGYVDGRLVVVDHIWLPRCQDDEINKAYQKKKIIKMDQYYKDRHQDVLADKARRGIDYLKPRDTTAHIAKCLENINTLIKKRKNGNLYLSQSDIESLCDVGSTVGGRIRGSLMRNRDIMVKLGLIDEYEIVKDEL